MMKQLREHMGSALACVCELVVGILLLINPIGFTSGIIIAAGVLLLLFGIGTTVQYFRTDAAAAAGQRQLTLGLLTIALGLFCAFRSQWFISTFPLLTMVYGVVILVMGIMKVQWAVDMLRMRMRGWQWTALSAAASLVFALLVLCNPFATTVVLWTFVGVSPIVEAAIDLLALVFTGRTFRIR